MKILERDNEQYYTLQDPLSGKRWMCGRCGLIFDYKFDEEGHGWPEFDPPLSAGYYGEDEDGNAYYEEPEHRELCPRCQADFSDAKLIPIVVSRYDFGNFAKTTFVVEDNCHATVVKQIARQLNKDKDIEVLEAGDSPNVKNFLRLAKQRGISASAYFMVDGDNKEIDKEFANEPNYIHLDKYCIESYLFDVSVISAMSRKSERTIRRTLAKTLKATSRDVTNKNKIAEKLLLELSRKEITVRVVAFLDASQILMPFLREMGFPDRDRYIEAYVRQAARMSKLGRVFPPLLVRAVRRAKRKS